MVKIKKIFLSISMLMAFFLTSCGTSVKKVDSVSDSYSDAIQTDIVQDENDRRFKWY